MDRESQDHKRLVPVDVCACDPGSHDPCAGPNGPAAATRSTELR